MQGFLCACGITEIVLGVLASLVALYYWINRNLNYFEKLGIPHPKPWPFVGNLGPIVFQKQNAGETYQKMYNAFPNNKFIGSYEMTKPNILIRDLDLIRQVTIKDFDHFTDHPPIGNEEHDFLFGNNLFSLRGQKWKDMRHTLSPAFTSSKMKAMYILVADSAEQMVKFLLKDMKNEPKIFEMKDLFTRYTNDVIATAAFGIKVDSLTDRNNEFYEMAKKSTNFSGILFMLKFMIIPLMPKLSNLLQIKFTADDVSTFFHKLISGTIEQRERQGIVRPDMIHLLMQAKQEILSDDANKEQQKKKLELTDEDITAQAFIFLFAGFDTSSTLMCFLSHELAINPDIQKRLLNEIDEVNAEEDKVSYETINNMKYMDMIISETLRLHPPADFTNRVCVKPYVLKDDVQNISLNVEVNTNVIIPTYAIQRDPQYFPNPDKFEPERFNDENKRNINPLAYIPFGIGPRICIGSRFALMETKLVLFYLLSEFTFEVCEKTQVPLQLKKDFSVTSERGFWIQLRPRAK